MWVKPPGLQYVEAHGVTVNRANYDSFIVRNDHGEDVTAQFQQSSANYKVANDKVSEIAEKVMSGQRLDVSQKVCASSTGQTRLSCKI